MARRGEITKPNPATLKQKSKPRHVRCFGLSDVGSVRHNNEDAFWYDEDSGVFVVVDGVGGQAAGEMAARQAVQTISSSLMADSDASDTRTRDAIIRANDAIFDLAVSNPAWTGMACVLTVAVLEDDRLTVGHVGDTRLYKIRHGKIHKLTHDHSPVGELEDSGIISESQAMAHPRRNEVFRDVGSEPYRATGEEFIEIVEDFFESDSALLLCSDGLSDLVPSTEILSAILDNAGNPEKTAEQLIRKAKAAGGKDNITALVVHGEDFASAGALTRAVDAADAAPKSLPALVRTFGRSLNRPLGTYAIFAVGIFLGMMVGALSPVRQEPAIVQPISRSPAVWKVGPGEQFTGIAEGLQAATAGDVIELGPGTYPGPMLLKDGVAIHGAGPELTVVKTVSPADGPIVSAVEVRARISGLQIEGDGMAPVGLLISNSSLEIQNLVVTGTTETAILIDGAGNSTIRAAEVRDNSGYGLRITGMASVFIAHSLFHKNRWMGTAVRPGIEITGQSRPIFFANFFDSPSAKTIEGIPPAELQEFFQQNSFTSKLSPSLPNH